MPVLWSRQSNRKNNRLGMRKVQKVLGKMSDKKYREFWLGIVDETNLQNIVADTKEEAEMYADEIYHVIEYAAYNQAIYELDKSRHDHCKIIEQLQREKDELVELLKEIHLMTGDFEYRYLHGGETKDAAIVISNILHKVNNVLAKREGEAE